MLEMVDMSHLVQHRSNVTRGMLLFGVNVFRDFNEMLYSLHVSFGLSRDNKKEDIKCGNLKTISLELFYTHFYSMLISFAQEVVIYRSSCQAN